MNEHQQSEPNAEEVAQRSPVDGCYIYSDCEELPAPEPMPTFSGGGLVPDQPASEPACKCGHPRSAHSLRCAPEGHCIASGCLCLGFETAASEPTSGRGADLRQLFRNRFSCWTTMGRKDTDDIGDVMAMDEDRFVEVVTDLLARSSSNRWTASWPARSHRQHPVDRQPLAYVAHDQCACQLG